MVTASALPQRTRHYAAHAIDSARWDAFEPRPDDIIICTAYKSGTTWTQRICSLLIFQTTTLDRPIGTISPWLDMKARPLEHVLGIYNAQRHRRFIKTHTPLDGLPYYPEADYLFCGRDPRDIFMSLLNHFQNANPDADADFVRESRESGEPRRSLPEDPGEMLRLWLTTPGMPWEKDGFPLWSVFHHAQSFWDYRHLPNIHFLHFADLQRDLEGEMRRVAKLLDIEVAEELWPDLVEAARFESMKAEADKAAPDTEFQMWRDNSRFFHHGTTGQWHGVLSAEDLRLFDEVMADRMEPALMRWMLNGSAVAGDPREL